MGAEISRSPNFWSLGSGSDAEAGGLAVSLRWGTPLNRGLLKLLLESRFGVTDDVAMSMYLLLKFVAPTEEYMGEWAGKEVTHPFRHLAL